MLCSPRVVGGYQYASFLILILNLLSCFPDLLWKDGLPPGGSVFLSEMKDIRPPPPSPRGATRGSSRGTSRSSSKSQEDEELEPSQDQFAGKTDMTQTFTSIPRSTFWIPVDENSTEKNERPSVDRKGESSSNGTKFYIDLGNLEALTSGQCSLCGDSLPEGSPVSRRGPVPDKELCKSCNPRRGSNEDVFWIPFTDKRKASALKNLNGVENGDDSAKANESRKLNERTKDQANKRQPDPTSSSAANGDSKALILENNTGKLNAPSFSADMTSFDASCVCDNNTGVCSCTIVKKDLPPSSRVTEESIHIRPANSSTSDATNETLATEDVVKTIGEASSLAESTVVTRSTTDFASPNRAVTPSNSKPRAKKDQGDLTLKSFSEVDLHNPSTSPRNSEDIRHGSVEAPQSLASQGAKLSSTQVVLNEGHLNGPILKAAIEPSPPKQAWTTPRSEDSGTSSVTIVNPFPSPVPPMNKSAVHPPIGPAGDGRIPNRRLTGVKKGKKSVGKPGSNSKNAKLRSKSKAPEQSNKGAKKKGKGRKKGDMKMITVQQREAGEELGLRTISQGGLDVAEESMDYLSALRPFNAGVFKGKHPVLSPIPESPRSTRNSPLSPNTVTLPRPADLQESLREGGNKVGEGNTEGFSEVGVTGEGDAENNGTPDGDFDVVDGGMLSRFIGMCVPRLKFGKSELEDDSASDDERNEPLLKHHQGGGNEEQQQELVETRSAEDADDRLSVQGGCNHLQVIQDEADDVMEEIVRRGLNSEQEYSRDGLPEVIAVTDVANDSEQYSDTDSSYNSIGSTSPRAVSPASSFNSSDTYFSSPRDSSGAETPTPGRDMSSENSIEIEYFEQMAREKSRVSSGSSNSTIRTQSNVSLGSLGNISQGSVGSFSGPETEDVVRSRLSASGRSQSSESCEEEIVWKKGNVLGKGAFGTVWCGLTNKGEMIAVKQVELNHNNSDEAEKVQCRLISIRLAGSCFSVHRRSMVHVSEKFGELERSVRATLNS